MGGTGANHRKRGRSEDVDDQEVARQLTSEVGEEEERETGAQESADDQGETGAQESADGESHSRRNHNVTIMSRMIRAGDYKVVVYMIGLVPL